MKTPALILAFAMGLAPCGAMAQSVQESIVSQLRTQGFEEITVRRTWLGRIQIVAQSSELQREIVFNPTTGEILRDYWVPLSDDADPINRLLVDPTPGDDNDARPANSSDDDSGSGNDDDDDNGSNSGSDDSSDDDDSNSGSDDPSKDNSGSNSGSDDSGENNRGSEQDDDGSDDNSGPGGGNDDEDEDEEKDENDDEDKN